MLTDEEIEEILADEDFDIGAVYDLGNGDLGESFNLCSPEMSERIRLAFEEGINAAKRKHKKAGAPMVVSWDGKNVHIQPNEMKVD
ncbi:MAG: hypothetical protein KBF52_09470 [Pyrinomonadaceae bacterium]|nr:hypothetical protein [Chloracidobacterium sp.]MBK9439434.1 hypothetical protein [Chloracidobacterium sp.]MBL0239279.1 hypothetical protein [Chloracidobacterium sp.]MBP9935994.1 hypothetical protein [Pyrinomonadaceae bacterium]